MDFSFPLDCMPKFNWDRDGVSFGSKRGNRLHAGVDLMAPAGTAVKAMASGLVVKYYPEFKCVNVTTTQPDGSRQVETYCASGIQVVHLVPPLVGTVIYGEITSKLRAQQKVAAGDVIGTIKELFPGQPNPMLHLEYYPGVVGNDSVFAKTRKPYGRAQTPADPSVLLWDFVLLLTNMGICKQPPRAKA